MKLVLPIVAVVMLGGCASLGGNYQISAYDAAGNELTKHDFLASRTGIYTVRNTLCSSYPQATLVIRNAESKEELAGESPYHCGK
ncbi:MAG: hypothetical protein GAK45_01039 [Pseudomonas citronellolis]|nr:MAG: hypothetical protein GAK45_01039 [Pseudomonas citronellolis]